MSTKLGKSIVMISLVTSLVATFASANAGVTISDKRYWPNEVGPGAYRSTDAQRGPRDAFAAIDGISASAARGEVSNAWHYIGGPKSPVPPSRGF
ncbi:MAG: hypothetical protein V7632_4451 [Bradyrhizobium sp.]